MSVDGRVSLYSASLLPVITMSVLKHVPRLLFSEFLNKATDDGAYISSYDAAPSSHSKTHILNSIWIKSLDQAEQRDILWIRKCSLPYPSNRPIRQMKKKTTITTRVYCFEGTIANILSADHISITMNDQKKANKCTAQSPCNNPRWLSLFFFRNYTNVYKHRSQRRKDYSHSVCWSQQFNNNYCTMCRLVNCMVKYIILQIFAKVCNCSKIHCFSLSGPLCS